MTASKKPAKSTAKYSSPEERRAARQAAGRIAGKRGGNVPGPKPLSVKDTAFVAGIAAGKSAKDAATAAGFSPESAPALLKREPVRAALAEVRHEILSEGRWGLVQALAEADDLISQSRQANQLSAAMKGLELKARLLGMLLDRQEIAVKEQPDLVAAIARAEGRLQALDVTDVEVLPPTPPALPVATVPAPARHIFLD